MTTPSDKYAARDGAILGHTSLYGLALYPTLSELFCDGKSPGNAVRKLELAGWLKSHQRALPGRLSYVRLTPAGCAKVCVPKERARPLGASAIDVAVACEFFCCLSDARRHKLEPLELRRFFGKDTPPANVAHLVAEDLGYPAVLRVFHAVSDLGRVQKALRDIDDQLLRNKTLRRWADAGDYGLVVLCPTLQKCQAVTVTLERSTLAGRLRTVVQLGPTAATLAQALRDRGKEQS